MTLKMHTIIGECHLLLDIQPDVVVCTRVFDNTEVRFTTVPEAVTYALEDIRATNIILMRQYTELGRTNASPGFRQYLADN